MKTIVVALVVLLAVPQGADAYLHFGFTVRGQTLRLHWTRMPVRWFATDRESTAYRRVSIPGGARAGLATWEAVPRRRNRVPVRRFYRRRAV